MKPELETLLKEAAPLYNEAKEILNRLSIYSPSDQTAVIALASILYGMRNDKGQQPSQSQPLLEVKPQEAGNVDIDALAKKVVSYMPLSQQQLQSKVLPYTILSAQFEGDDDNENCCKTLESFTKSLTAYGWAYEKMWMKFGRIRDDFNGLLLLNPADIERVEDRDDDEEKTIRVYYTYGNAAFSLIFVPSEPVEARYTTYHPEFRQGLHDLEAFGMHDKWEFVKLMNNLIKNANPKSDSLEKSAASLIEIGDWYQSTEI